MFRLPSEIKILGILLLIIGSIYFSYKSGADSVKAEYNTAISKMAKRHYEMQTKLDDYAAKYLAEKAKKQQVKIRTVEKAQREITKLPVRDCGWTSAEWVQLNNAYCAAFPDIPDCLHAGLSRSAPDVSSAGRPVPQTPGDSADDRLRDLSGRETGMPGATGETP